VKNYDFTEALLREDEIKTKPAHTPTLYSESFKKNIDIFSVFGKLKGKMRIKVKHSQTFFRGKQG